MNNKHEPYELKQMQSMPLEIKIKMSQRRIKEWYEAFDGMVYVSFSGGKDSTVLKHIIDQMYDDVPAVFVNTGLEYPEIQKFVRDIKCGKYKCFNSDVEIIKPEKRFDEVIKEYGYPVASKEIANTVRGAKHAKDGKWKNTRLQRLNGELLDPQGNKSKYNCSKWKFLLDAPFEVSEKCCDIMKKKPAMGYEKQTKRKPIIGTMAEESRVRQQGWLRTGCNVFEGAKQKSMPLSFWTEQDILQYIIKNNIPIASVYGEIIPLGEMVGQMYIESCEPKLTLTGVNRTGCMFCMFGVHLESEPNRFQRMKETHPKQWDYCINKLGLKEVLEYIEVPYE